MWVFFKHISPTLDETMIWIASLYTFFERSWRLVDWGKALCDIYAYDIITDFFKRADQTILVDLHFLKGWTISQQEVFPKPRQLPQNQQSASYTRISCYQVCKDNVLSPMHFITKITFYFIIQPQHITLLRYSLSTQTLTRPPSPSGASRNKIQRFFFCLLYLLIMAHVSHSLILKVSDASNT